jgi:crotonobetainyl-CoA:carnitine CoA-transferase CaiB-like acyl-CoA transferase
MGAGVVRLERPSATLAGETPISDEDRVLNRGKRSLAVDLRHEGGRAVLHRLAARADAVIECYRPGVAERLGADWRQLEAINPRLVCCSLSGFGQTGPARSAPAYDLVFTAWSGLLRALSGVDPPRVPGTYLADSVSGLTAALAIVLALFERERTGCGRRLDVAMLDSAFALLAVSHGQGSSPEQATAEAGPSPLYGFYESADGRHLALAALRPSSVTALLNEVGRPDLVERAQARTGGEELAAVLRRAFASGTAEEWTERLRRLDVEIGVVHRPEEAFADPQLRSRGLVEEPPAGDRDTRPLITTALRPTWGERAGEARPAPRPGQHSDELLRELGFAPAEIARLRRDGTV